MLLSASKNRKYLEGLLGLWLKNDLTVDLFCLAFSPLIQFLPGPYFYGWAQNGFDRKIELIFYLVWILDFFVKKNFWFDLINSIKIKFN